MPVPLQVTPCKPALAQHHSDFHSSKVNVSRIETAVLPSPVSVIPTLTRSDSSSSSEDFDVIIKKIVKTTHKLREENGEFMTEPLLKENPHRFVLFPIQDNEVRRCDPLY